MQVQIVLVDVNPKMVEAWRNSFENNPEVQVVHGSMLDQGVDAWASPTNSFGRMNGGLDLIIKKHFGTRIETAVQQEIQRLYNGVMPVGHAVCVRTGATVPKFLISTPTMSRTREDVSDTLNVALACAAAIQRAVVQNRQEPGAIASLALPGLGANFGKVPVEICADLMWTSYELVRNNDFADFKAMRDALEGELGDLDAGKKPVRAPMPPQPTQRPPSSPVSRPVGPPPAQGRPADLDFDDT